MWSWRIIQTNHVLWTMLLHDRDYEVREVTNRNDQAA